jgi:hypothetical protein
VEAARVFWVQKRLVDLDRGVNQLRETPHAGGPAIQDIHARHANKPRLAAAHQRDAHAVAADQSPAIVGD